MNKDRLFFRSFTASNGVVLGSAVTSALSSKNPELARIANAVMVVSVINSAVLFYQFYKYDKLKK